ncbi:MAG: xanthine dehydrogenase molybdopterin binding subunit [Granulosicoccus sp.]|nr:xanthine dehydrogenase molybdopterin binding subunit [Granulosicoccus sp.]
MKIDKLLPHESARLHVSGQAVYTDDIPELTNTLYCALGLSQRAHAHITRLDLAEVRNSAGVVDVITADDIPGANDCGPIVNDDPILADGLVQCVGQPIFAVVATSYESARRAVRKARVDYEDLPAVLTPKEALQKQSFVVPPMHCQRGNPDSKLEKSPHRVTGELTVGGQEQFYLEGQISYAIPREDNTLHVYCSTQHPTEMQHLIANSLNLSSNAVTVEVRRMGGGFGGKESQSALFACVASIAAQRLKKPIKLRLDRDDDFMATGKRHCFYYEYDVGHDDDGRILAAKVTMVSRAGYSTDLSPPVATRALCHFDNAYYLSDVSIQVMCGKTNTQSNTAFRGFGGPQGAIVMEYVIDDIARNLNKDALEIRKCNFYGKTDRNTTPYQQVIKDNIIDELVCQLESSSEYRRRRDEIKAFNTQNPFIKKGIALTPVKFGISFNLVHFNQAGALVHVYTDGSILVNHGGTEMGQGLHTKVAQVVAHTMGVSIERVRSTATVTDKIPNTSATAASTGADLNGKAAEDAALQIKSRLISFAAEKFGVDESTVIFADDQVSINGQVVSFPDLVNDAYQARVQLWSDGFYATPGLSWDATTLTGNPFYYFAYGAAVSEVAVDTLTGEWKLLRADLLHDVGNPINEAIDIGQVEGGFIQGMGWLTTEELYWDKEGRLRTHAPSTYKIPAINDCPENFQTTLYKNQNREDTILRSKAAGEPPLLLSFSVLFAIRDAIASVADYQYNPVLPAPATPEKILGAVTALQTRQDEQ